MVKRGVLQCADVGGPQVVWLGVGLARVSTGKRSAVMGVRVSEDEEDKGLDISEHGQEAYPDFTTASDH